MIKSGSSFWARGHGANRFSKAVGSDGREDDQRKHVCIFMADWQYLCNEIEQCPNHGDHIRLADKS